MYSQVSNYIIFKSCTCYSYKQHGNEEKGKVDMLGTSQGRARTRNHDFKDIHYMEGWTQWKVQTWQTLHV